MIYFNECWGPEKKGCNKSQNGQSQRSTGDNQQVHYVQVSSHGAPHQNKQETTKHVHTTVNNLGQIFGNDPCHCYTMPAATQNNPYSWNDQFHSCIIDAEKQLFTYLKLTCCIIYGNCYYLLNQIIFFFIYLLSWVKGWKTNAKAWVCIDWSQCMNRIQ